MKQAQKRLHCWPGGYVGRKGNQIRNPTSNMVTTNLSDLNRQDFYWYLQVQHFLWTEIRSSSDSDGNFSKLIQTFIDAYQGENIKGVIGKLYSAISSVNKNSTDYVRQGWEKYMKMEIPEEVWLRA